MKYAEELKRSMNYLGKKPKSIFLGQAVEVAGTAMSNTLKKVPKNKLYEFPVTEEMQNGCHNRFINARFRSYFDLPKMEFSYIGSKSTYKSFR